MRKDRKIKDCRLRKEERGHTSWSLLFHGCHLMVSQRRVPIDFSSRDQKWLLSRHGLDILCEMGYSSRIQRSLIPTPLPLLRTVWAEAHFAQGYWVYWATKAD